MRRTYLLLGSALTMVAAPAMAETLKEALLKAYNTNPTLSADRANVRAVDENVPIARSQALPSLSVSGSYSENVVKAANNFVSPDRGLTGQTTFSVPIYAGGAIGNAIKAAEVRVEQSRFGLRNTESQLFTAVVGAYMDVIRDEAIVSLNRQNVKVLDINLQASSDRFQVGDLTRTDVAQSQARLAVARSQLQTAEARLISSRESYIRLIGDAPGTLETPPPVPDNPADPDAAVDIAIRNNPALLAAEKARDAARLDESVARAGRIPKLSVNVGGNYYNYLGSLGAGTGQSITQSGTAATVGLGLTVPLYQGGRPAAEVRQAQERRGQAIEQVTEAEREVIANTRSAYAVWKSSEEVIASSEVAVNANRLSLEGVRAENSVGNRTILDILNAEQELLNSQVTLVTARRDAYVARFALQAAMGRAEARDLGLGGGALYDPVVNYKRVHNKWSDWGSDPEPVAQATTTRGTTAQGAEVTKPLDPILDTPVDRDVANPAGTPR